MCSLFLAIALVFAVLIYATRANVVRTELRGANAEMRRLLVAVEHEYKALELFTVDWAEWDDSYQFIADGNDEFIETNLDGEWLTRVDIDFIGFYDHEGKPVFEWYGGNIARDAPIPSDLRAHLKPGSALLRTKGSGEGTRGVVMIGSLPILMVSRASLDSSGLGPTRGSLVAGRILNPEDVQELADVGKQAITTSSVKDRSGSPELAEAFSHVSPRGRVHIQLTRPHALTGHGLLLDPEGRPSGMLTADLRSIGYAGTPQLVGVVVGIILLFGLIWSNATFSMIDRASLARVSWLRESVSALATTVGNEDLRLNLENDTHQDEISELAHEINTMLDMLHASQRARSESEEWNRLLVDNMADAVLVLDTDGMITFASQQAEAFTGRPTEDLIGMSYTDLMSEDSVRVVESQFASPESMGARRIREVNFTHEKGSITPVELSASPVRDGGGNVVAVQWIARDVAERKQFERQLVHLANHDHMTGLINRRRFEEELAGHLAECRRTGSTGAMLWIDLDGFKEINDAFGHRVGDDILVRLAETLRRTSRADHVVARLGGDEFAVLMPVCNRAGAQAASMRILEEIRTSIKHHDGLDLRVTASIGLLEFPDQGTSVEEVIGRADLAMYRAKQDGGNRYCSYTPAEEWKSEATERHLWSQRIESAIAEDRLVAYAQPIIEIASGETVRYELLVRLIENGEVLAPGDFLMHAENLGIINDIDRWMLGEALELIGICQAEGRAVHLEVNLSGKAFGDPSFLAHIKTQIAESGIDASHLGFEITETALIRNIGHALHFIGELREIGCSFSLDDFGSGFSSFYYLRHLPIDVLKIDGTLVRELPMNTRDQHLVRAMIELSTGLGMRSIAEGIEDAATMDFLREFGVDMAQGYFVARPAPAREMPGVGKPAEDALPSGGRDA